MMRKLVFEGLDARLCMAFGDVVSEFADQGEFSVSFRELDRQYSRFVATFAEPDGYLQVANSRAGSGTIFTLAKTDLEGAPDLSFGNGGLVQFIDPAVPGATIGHAVQLADGGLLLRTSSKTLTSLMKLKPDGSLDADFGTGGFQRQTFNPASFATQVAADRGGGFFVLESDSQTFQSVLTHYRSDGQIDTSFGNAGSVETTRLYDSRMAVDAAGQITVVGLDTLSNLDIVAYRFHDDGTADSDFGTNGVARLPNHSSAPQFELVDDGSAVLLSQSSTTDGTQSINITRYTSELTVDTSFGDEGTAQVEVGPTTTNPTITRVLSDASGVTLVRGEMVYSSPRRTLLTAVKLTRDGQVDESFGTAGRMSEQIDQLLVFQKVELDGRGGFLWFGTTQPVANANYIFDSFIIHTRADGHPDLAWGPDGVRSFQVTPQSQRIDLLQLDALGQGQMRLTSGWPTFNSPSPNIGRADTLGPGGELVRSVPFGREISKQYTVTAPASNGGWYIAQYLNRGPAGSRIEISAYYFDGSLNTSFGDDGLMQIPADDIWTLFMRASRDGSIALAAGTLANEADPSTSNGVAVVVRLLADGSPDESFGPGGVQRLYEKGGTVADVLTDPELGTALVVDPYDAQGVQLQLLRSDGSLDSGFGSGGLLSIPGNIEWRAGDIDEMGRILIVTKERYPGSVYKLYQFDSHGRAVASFGDSGSVQLPIQVNETLDAASMSVRHGVIAVAAAHERADNVIRLLAYDYAGQPLTELGGDGVRDYDLSPAGVLMSDLAFAGDGSLWMATSQRRGFDQVGSLIKLEGAQDSGKHNWGAPLDVTGDGQVAPLDALLVISTINGFESPPDALLDVNADMQVTAIDALLIINAINSRTAEGESSRSIPEPAPPTATAYALIDAFADMESLHKRLSR